MRIRILIAALLTGLLTAIGHAQFFAPMPFFQHANAVPLALDGSNFKNTASGGSSTITLTTTKPNDIIIVAYTGNTLNSVSDTAGLTWTKRGNDGVSWAGFWAVAASVLSGDTISYNVTGASFSNVWVFGVSGGNTSSPFDPNAANPNFNHSASSGFNTTISTTNTNTFGFGCYGSGLGSPTPGAGWTLVNADHSHFGLCQYQIFSAAQSGTTVAATVGASPGWYVDAITK